MEQNRNLKFEKISKLAEETSARIIQNANEWKNYLTTVGQVYKYPYCDQLLIHAQRPDATACASLQIWNEKMQCRVNRGAKGIALIDTDNKYQTFRGGNRTDGVNLQLIKEPDSDEKSLSGSFMGNRAANGSTGFSPKEKFRRNMEAIRTLTEIESENRIATPGEQQILKQYVGWGGLADAFDETKENWTNEYQELKRLLSPEEYASARESTLNAHYTSPDIIKNIYVALDRMGFEKGNILEPAMGIGNFFERHQGRSRYTEIMKQ